MLLSEGAVKDYSVSLCLQKMIQYKSVALGSSAEEIDVPQYSFPLSRLINAMVFYTQFLCIVLFIYSFTTTSCIGSNPSLVLDLQGKSSIIRLCCKFAGAKPITLTD